MEAAEAVPPPPHLPLEAGVPTDEELAPCATCGRTFVISSLQRHSAVCKKNSTPSRAKFDSSRQRLHGTGLEPYKPPPPVKARPRSRSVPGECLYLNFANLCSNWTGIRSWCRFCAQVQKLMMFSCCISLFTLAPRRDGFPCFAFRYAPVSLLLHVNWICRCL